MANTHTLNIANLTVKKGPYSILRDVSLEFRSNQVAVILGATGGGKSTLVRAIAGLDPLTSGRITLDGADLTGLPSYKRDGIASVLQHPGMFPKTTPRQNLQMVVDCHKTRSANGFNNIDEILKLMDLTDLADERVDSFSGGEIARVALARAIAADPVFLIVDEALSAVDAPLRRRILRGLTDYYMTQNKGIIFITHDQLDAFMFADLLVLIDEGIVAAKGSPKEVYRAPPTRGVGEFLGLATPLAGELQRGDASGETERCYVSALKKYVSVRISGNTTSRDVTLIVRPEDVIVQPIGIGLHEEEFNGSVIRTMFTGGVSYLLLKVEPSGLTLIAHDPSEQPVNRFKDGEYVAIRLRDEITAVCD